MPWPCARRDDSFGVDVDVVPRGGRQGCLPDSIGVHGGVNRIRLINRGGRGG